MSILRPLLLLLALLPAACSWLPEQIDLTENWTADRLYSEAKDNLLDGNYQTATDYYNKLQARYPFGRLAQQAQIDLIYAHYKSGEADQAIAAADRFIRSNPRHPLVDYAYYLKGVVNFNRGATALERLLPGDPTKTDTGTMVQAFNDFSELVRLFPDSKYSQDAQQRMLFLYNNLAGHELNVGDFYLRRGAYVAAVNRAQYVLENYARSPRAADALALMVRAYTRMDTPELAADALRVLSLNYPDHEQLDELDRLVRGEASGGFSLFGG